MVAYEQGGLEVIKIENLYNFDGERGYALAQGEQAITRFSDLGAQKTINLIVFSSNKIDFHRIYARSSTTSSYQ